MMVIVQWLYTAQTTLQCLVQKQKHKSGTWHNYYKVYNYIKSMKEFKGLIN